jgi:hypothetical protein
VENCGKLVEKKKGIPQGAEKPYFSPQAALCSPRSIPIFSTDFSKFSTDLKAYIKKNLIPLCHMGFDKARQKVCPDRHFPSCPCPQISDQSCSLLMPSKS